MTFIYNRASKPMALMRIAKRSVSQKPFPLCPSRPNRPRISMIRIFRPVTRTKVLRRCEPTSVSTHPNGPTHSYRISRAIEGMRFADFFTFSECSQKEDVYWKGDSRSAELSRNCSGRRGTRDTSRCRCIEGSRNQVRPLPIRHRCVIEKGKI